MVSKKKKRFTEDGFDLDLSYVTPRIIAMGFPSSGVEGMYRNPLPEVQRFFKKRHDKHYKIYNLCSERSYDLEGLFDHVEVFPFDDHNPCAIKLIERFCANADAYLAQDPANVVAIHCKAGKGRTGTLVAAYLLHSGICSSAEEALSMFSKMRTHNNKGVTIPSQIRYVHYYESLLRRKEVLSYTYQITHIRFITVPNFDHSITGGGCDPYVVVKMLFPVMEGEQNSHICRQHTVFNQYKAENKVSKFYPNDSIVNFDMQAFDLKVRGDVTLQFFNHDNYSSDAKMCQIWINTAFIERNFLVFDKSVVDRACKDKHNRAFDADFKVEVFLHRVDDDNDIDIATYADDEAEHEHEEDEDDL